MTDAPLMMQRDRAVAVVTLNRPNAYNALNLELADELLTTMIEVAEDREVRAVLLKGAGSAFCAGGDIRQMHEYLERDGPQVGF